MQIFKSRFTPNVTADEVRLDIGECVLYTHSDGRKLNVKIDCERVSHPNCGNLGYEVVQENGNRFFADGKRLRFDPNFWPDQNAPKVEA